MTYYRAIIRLGLPILVGQAGTVIVGFADNIMVGHYSTDALASASFVVNVFNMIMFCCMGFTYGVLPLSGAIFARGDKRGIGELVRNALLLNAIYTLGLTLVMTVLYFNLELLDQPEELLPEIRPYYLLYLVGLVPISVFNVFAQWSYSIKNSTMPMWIIIISNVMNIAGNYAFIYGNWGSPEMGLYGAGLSTLIARIFAMVAIVALFLGRKAFRQYREGFLSGRFSKGQMALVWRTSLPVSMQMTFESASFSVAAIMAGWVGTVALAAYQMIVIVGMLGFCLYYAIGSAIAILVSNEAGKGANGDMRRVAWDGYHVMLALAACSTLTFVFFGKYLMQLFTEDLVVITAATALILPLVFYQLGDATQITFANALRGTSHVMPMLWIAFVSYIVVGIPVTYIMAFPLGMETYGIILSFSVSLFLAGALFLCYFLRATDKGK